MLRLGVNKSNLTIHFAALQQSIRSLPTTTGASCSNGTLFTLDITIEGMSRLPVYFLSHGGVSTSSRLLNSDLVLAWAGFPAPTLMPNIVYYIDHPAHQKVKEIGRVINQSQAQRTHRIFGALAGGKSRSIRDQHSNDDRSDLRMKNLARRRLGHR